MFCYVLLEKDRSKSRDLSNQHFLCFFDTFRIDTLAQFVTAVSMRALSHSYLPLSLYNLKLRKLAISFFSSSILFPSVIADDKLSVRETNDI